LKREVEEGKHLVVLSNQADSRPKIRAEWKAKLPLIAAKVSFSSRYPLFFSLIFLFLFFRSCKEIQSQEGADDRCPQIPLYES
jgi:hypothetical protein